MDSSIVVQRDIILNLENCLSIISTSPERLYGVIGQLESMIAALSAFSETSWATEVCKLMSEAAETMHLHLRKPTRSSDIDRFQITKECLQTLLGLGFSVPKISSMFACCNRTIFRRLHDFGLKVGDTYSAISEQDLETQVIAVLTQQPNTGYKRMKGHLSVRGVKVPERRLRAIMRKVDPVGVLQRTARRNRTILRRQYFVKYSNEIWHIDANIKLIRWGFVIRAGVDGKSRAATYIAVSSDNMSCTHLASFLEGVAKWGLPLRTRTDKGKENMGIARCMIENRGTGRSSHICGRSVHNQRIERFWRDLSEGCMAPFYNIFLALEEDGHLDINNLKHLYLLHWIFIPRLNTSAQEFIDGWNSHPIRTARNMTPLQMMATNLFPAEYESSLSDLVNNSAGDLMVSNEADLILMDDESITNPVQVLNTLSTTENYRINLFNRYENDRNIFSSYDLYVKAVREILD